MTLAHALECIRDYECDNNVAIGKNDVLLAINIAAERFVDSMQANERDTEDEVKNGMRNGYPIDPLESRLSHWETMRPISPKNKMNRNKAIKQATAEVGGLHLVSEKMWSYLAWSTIHKSWISSPARPYASARAQQAQARIDRACALLDTPSASYQGGKWTRFVG